MSNFSINSSFCGCCSWSMPWPSLECITCRFVITQLRGSFSCQVINSQGLFIPYVLEDSFLVAVVYYCGGLFVNFCTSSPVPLCRLSGCEMYRPSSSHQEGNLVRRRYGSESEEDKGSSYVINTSSTQQTFAASEEQSLLTSSSSHQTSSVMSLSNASRDRTQEFLNTVRSFQVRIVFYKGS